VSANAQTPCCGRVCVVAPMPPPYGGMSLQAEKLVSRLRAEGVSVTVISTNPPLPAILAWAGKVPGLRTCIREVQYLILTAKEMSKCEIFHHFSASGLYFWAHSLPLLLAGRLRRKRVILNYRGGKAADFLSRWNWLAVPVMGLAAQICVPSEFLQQVFDKYRLDSTLLPNLADVEKFPWKDRSYFAPALLVTRHLEPMYNTECLLRAFRIVQKRFPAAVLSVAGDGSQARRLRDLVDEWSVSGVRFLGAIAHADLPALYAAHDLYINSSSVDNFPGALVEAACSGLPIVTTGAGGIPWMIRNHERGIVVELNDDKALAAGVIDIIENPKLGQRLAREARTWAEQFSWNHVFPKLMACYGSSSVANGLHLSEAEVLPR